MISGNSDPAAVNKLVTGAGGIYDNGDIVWKPAGEVLGLFYLGEVPFSEKEVRKALCTGGKPIAHVPGHYVVITGEEPRVGGGCHFSIADPAGGATPSKAFLAPSGKQPFPDEYTCASVIIYSPTIGNQAGDHSTVHCGPRQLVFDSIGRKGVNAL
jgi:hypothetical protein